MSTDVTANTLFCGPDCGLLENVVLRHDNGIITSISESAPPRTARRTFVIPAFVNAHDHARPTASSFGAVNMPLESWIIRSAFGIDRKSTRLNSSHSQISYAVFCLKKKTKNQQIMRADVSEFVYRARTVSAAGFKKTLVSPLPDYLACVPMLRLYFDNGYATCGNVE